MTMTQIEQRVKALEQTVKHLAKSGRRWYRTHAGRFANDPVFDEIVELGQRYRRSQGPSRHTKRS